jgi:alpha-tubulin suppressor-like RCC1 family protein
VFKAIADAVSYSCSTSEGPSRVCGGVDPKLACRVCGVSPADGQDDMLRCDRQQVQTGTMRHLNSLLVGSILFVGCGARSSLGWLDGSVGGGMSSSGASTSAAGATGDLSATGGVPSTGGSTNTTLAAKSITVGEQHSCALLNDASIRCWGDNEYNQLGNGSRDACGLASGSLTPCSMTPIEVLEITNAEVVAAGSAHTCAVMSSGSVQCWGGNDNGQLGNRSSDTCATPAGTAFSCSATPTAVLGITSATAVAAGGWHTCAVLRSGSVQCWGLNDYGQLGNGATSNSLVPVEVSGITNARSVASNTHHSCAVLRSGSVQCWGYNYNGQLGDGTTANSLVPVTVSGITNAEAIATGSLHTCALLNGGSIRCWGVDQEGQLGNNSRATCGSSPGTVYRCSPIPLTVSGITDAVFVSAGQAHTCAVLSSGSVQCWGWNNAGQLANGTTINSFVPVTIPSVTDAASVAAGSYDSCAVLSSGSVQCWNWNYYGNLGNGTTTNSQVPVTVSGF